MLDELEQTKCLGAGTESHVEDESIVLNALTREYDILRLQLQALEEEQLPKQIELAQYSSDDCRDRQACSRMRPAKAMTF